MGKIALAVHGGAGPDSEQIRNNIDGYKDGMRKAINVGYTILENGGSAIDAVEAAVRMLEDLPLFNAGRGSAINHKGEIEMDASIMDGSNLKAGAVSMLKNVKNPITLAKFIMNHTNHILLSDSGALELARDAGIELEPDAYFVTTDRYDEFLKERDNEYLQDLLRKRVHGTVGAVALDEKGNLAAATSTGGTTNSLSGRIGDSCLIGAGCYANNKTCAVSGTGDGEFLISGVIAHSISAAIDLAKMPIQEACDFVVQEQNKHVEGCIGVICLDPEGNFGISFNSPHMHRAWKSSDVPFEVRIYRE
jgi:beta-aspartyl-peptidase (threonine type)